MIGRQTQSISIKEHLRQCSVEHESLGYACAERELAKLDFAGQESATCECSKKGFLERFFICMLSCMLVCCLMASPAQLAFASNQSTQNDFSPLAATLDEMGIVDIQIVNADTGDSYGYTSREEKNPIEITSKGGTITLLCRATWNDGSTTENPVGLSITSEDVSIAQVAGTVITAVDDGETIIHVTVSEYTQSGEPLEMDIPIVVSGQSARYVQSISIYNTSDDSASAIYIEEDLSTVLLEFYAIVEVFDPSTQMTTVYDSRNGLLSDQASDLADLAWQVSDTQLASVNEYGQYRPSEYATCSVWALSTGGLASAGSVGYIQSNQIGVTVDDPEGEPESHPQSTITINVWYENLPDSVVTKVYTVSDLEAIGTFTATYTLVASSTGAAIEATGYGVDLEALLVDACELDPSQGVSAVRTLTFVDCNNASKTISASMLFSTRYYYPNIDINSSSGAQAVRPMLAFNSNWQRVNAGSESSITEATRFRLLLGSTSTTDSVTGYAWKWVNTVNVILAGGPQTENGDGDSGGGDSEPDIDSEPDADSEPESDPPAATTPDDDDPSIEESLLGGGSEGGSGDESGQATPGGGDDSTADAEQGDSISLNQNSSGDENSDEQSDTLNTADASSEDATDASSEASGLGEGDNSGDGSADEGAWSIYQVMNPFSSAIDIDYEDNPLAPFVLPCSIGFILLGILQGAYWYYRQTRKFVFASDVGSA